MGPFVEHAVVALVVAAALLYALMRLSPKGARLALARRLARVARVLGVSDVDARRVEAKLSTGGACGSCDDCNACRTPVATTNDDRRIIPIRPG